VLLGAVDAGGQPVGFLDDAGVVEGAILRGAGQQLVALVA
jgi:hypothetical protein